MFSNKLSQIVTLVILSFLIIPLTSPITSVSGYSPDHQGPYLDGFQCIEYSGGVGAALGEGIVDIVYSRPESMGGTNGYETIEVEMSNVHQLYINTQRYPYNFTEFRQALAFAIDKANMVATIYSNLAAPIDSAIPSYSPFSAEDELSYSYIDSDGTQAITLLDSAGFDNVDSDTYREAPDGSDFSVKILIYEGSSTGQSVASSVQTVLTNLNINATIDDMSFNQFYNKFYFSKDYDIAFASNLVPKMEIGSFGYDYHGEYADEYYINYPRFANATFDEHADNFNNPGSFDDVRSAAIEMQKILHFECPIIPIAIPHKMTSYRNDTFTGVVPGISRGFDFWWTNFLAKYNEEQTEEIGGVLKWAIDQSITYDFIDSGTNIDWSIADILWDPLIRVDPNGEIIPWLAKSYTIETHDDNPGISIGDFHVTIHLRNNATWSDGDSIEASDIATCFDYYANNIFGFDVDNSVVLDTYILRLEFDSQSWFDFLKVSTYPILSPEIISTLTGGSGFPNPGDTDFVTSGAFTAEEREDDTWTFNRRDGYFLSPFYILGLENTQTPPLPLDNQMLMLVITGGAMASVILLVIVFFMKNRSPT